MAFRYNDRSVLENYRCSEFFNLLKDREDLNIFRHLKPAAKKRMRKLIIQSVLGTDMRFHFDIFNELKTKLENEISTKNEEDLFVGLSDR